MEEWGEDFDSVEEINELIGNINYIMDEGVKGVNFSVEHLEEIQRHMSLIIEQGIFWLKQQNAERYVYDLRNFLIWLCDFIEAKDESF